VESQLGVASWIIEAREKDTPFRIYGNVMNSTDGGGTLITNLPASGCVEVACMIDRSGVRATRYGALPPQMAALCDWNMRMFDLGAPSRDRAEQGEGDSCVDARPAHRGGVQPGRDQADDA